MSTLAIGIVVALAIWGGLLAILYCALVVGGRSDG